MSPEPTTNDYLADKNPECKCGFRAPELGPHPGCSVHSDYLADYELNDEELPGRWERADFLSGDPDERSYVERTRTPCRQGCACSGGLGYCD